MDYTSKRKKITVATNRQLPDAYYSSRNTIYKLYSYFKYSGKDVREHVYRSIFLFIYNSTAAK